MEDLIKSGINNSKSSEEYNFFLDGDLSQMSKQKNFLNENGIVTQQRNVYPCLKEEDVKKALTLIWNKNCPGWWHYQNKYVEYGICTKEDFQSKLNKN